MAAATFEAALAETLRHEGGYVDHPLDPGGATNMGITRATLAAWRGRPVAKSEVIALGRAEAAAIYRARYWDAVAGDRLPAGVDLAVFDFAVNSGPARAIRTLQSVVGVPTTGRIDGALTALLHRRPSAEVVRALMARRRGFLVRLSTWSVFGRGWSRRLDAVEAVALKLCRTAAPSAPSAPPARPVTPPVHPAKEKQPVTLTKTLLESRTVWTNAIGLAAVALGAFGFDTGSIETDRLIEAGCQTVAGIGFVLSTVFRVMATRRITR